jgi:hypothetical protein
MKRQHEREGIITLTKDNLFPVDSVVIPDEYRVRALELSNLLG